jgi:hypothetical protein
MTGDWADHVGADAVGVTYGERNIGSLEINEVSYFNANPDWVELFSPTDQNLNIDTFCLKADSGACYDYPDGLERIPPGGYLILRFTAGTDDPLWSDGDHGVVYFGDLDMNDSASPSSSSIDISDTNLSYDWAGTGGPDAAQTTYGYRNYTGAFISMLTALKLTGLAAMPLSTLPPAALLAQCASLAAAGAGWLLRRREN